MRVLNRALAAAAGALVLSSLLPFQGAWADAGPHSLHAVCTDGHGAGFFSPGDFPVTVVGGEDVAADCYLNYASGGAKLIPTDIRVTLSAASVAASGYTPQQLAGLIQARSTVEGDMANDWTVLHWTVQPDGSLALTIPACANPNCGSPNFQLSGAPRVGRAQLKAEFKPLNPVYDGSPVAVTYDYVGRAGSQPYTPATPGTFSPLTPARLLDTRYGTGAPKAKVGPNQSVSVQVAGLAGVPATGVTAVVLNVTATGGTADSYVTAYPHGAARPTASNLNFRARQTIPNQVTVPVQDGKVDLYNFAGDVDLVADISGYYRAGDAGQRYNTVTPKRLLDTRNFGQNPLGPGGTVTVDIAGSYPAATAVTLNVTATRATAGSYVTVYPHGATRPTASNLNFTAGQTIPNQVTVPVRDGKVDLYNFAGSVDLVADISGYYGATGSAFVPTGPTRVLDTRKDPGKPLAGGKELDIQPNSWKYGIQPFGVTAVAMNVTATRGTTSGFLLAHPNDGCPWDHGQLPVLDHSNLNFTAGQTIANAVTSGLPAPMSCANGLNGGSDGGTWGDAVSIYNSSGQVDVVADVSGYFVQS